MVRESRGPTPRTGREKTSLKAIRRSVDFRLGELRHFEYGQDDIPVVLELKDPSRRPWPKWSPASGPKSSLSRPPLIGSGSSRHPDLLSGHKRCAVRPCAALRSSRRVPRRSGQEPLPSGGPPASSLRPSRCGIPPVVARPFYAAPQPNRQSPMRLDPSSSRSYLPTLPPPFTGRVRRTHVSRKPSVVRRW